MTAPRACTFDLEVSGKRGIAFFRSRGSPARRSTRNSRTSRPSTRSTSLADRYIELYITGQIDQVKVAYMKFINAARQMPVVETLLPLSSLPSRRASPRRK